jgi:hypothetical protein
MDTITISLKKYEALVATALQAKNLTDYMKKGEDFDFMVKHGAKRIEEKFQDTGLEL